MNKYYLKKILKKLNILFAICFFLISTKTYAEKICAPPIFEKRTKKENNDEKNWAKFDGYLIGNIIINSHKQFDLTKTKSKFLRQIYITLESLTPNVNSDIILSRIPFTEKNRLDIKKLKFAKRNLEAISYITDIKITLEENPLDNTYVDIKISFKNKFSIMVDGLSLIICSSNFLGTGHQISFRAIPLSYTQAEPENVFLHGYEMSYFAPNIHNTKFDFRLDYKKHTNFNLAKFKLNRHFYRTVKIGGGVFNAVGFRNIKTIGLEEKNYKYKYNHFNIWGGKTANIWIENYNEFYKRLIFTLGANDYRFIERPENLKIGDIPILYDQRSLGIGICFMKKKVSILDDSYGRNNRDIIYMGHKLYLYGGFLSNSQYYFVVDFSKGHFIKKIGYFFLNAKALKLTGGYFQNTNDDDKTIASSLSFDNQLGYISSKKKIIIDIRQIITFNYLVNFSETLRNLNSIDGFHYIDSYSNTYSNLKQRFQACFETIFYNPYKISSISFDPFIFIETLFTESIDHTKTDIQKIINNDFSFGGGLLFSAFGFNLRTGIGYCPTLENKEIRVNIILGKSFSFETADIQVSSPAYRPFT